MGPPLPTPQRAYLRNRCDSKLVLHRGPAPRARQLARTLRNDESPALARLSSYSGGGIRTRDLRVMSPTSYLAAPPRDGEVSLPRLAIALRSSGRRPPSRC